MEKIINLINASVENTFKILGYEEKYAKVVLSNRPDLCEYQCNAAMALAKQLKKDPYLIASEIVENLKENKPQIFSKIEVVRPGFINLDLDDVFLLNYINEMYSSEKFGLNNEEHPKKIIIDYGGPNVAKPLHVGHLRSAIIGESLKRIERFVGNEIIGDVHLGDWGLQIGLIITELKCRNDKLPYFDENFTGEYPKDAPFTMAELEEIYPTAASKSKVDEVYKEYALSVTAKLQAGHRGYTALWNHILDISIQDLKKNYDKLGVSFELWNKESDVQKYIPEIVSSAKKDGFAYLNDGALIVDVALDDDKKEVPPCILLKSDGASLYSTTDIATIFERVKLFNPTDIIYVVDKRQSLHFEQVFRTVRKLGIAPKDLNLTFIGFGTMNGKDGKPFKTRSGGVMRLERLIDDISSEVVNKMSDRNLDSEDENIISKQVGIAALKYGDLSNQPNKDYVFDIDRFISFEGNTGPYIQYTAVRIKSIIEKFISENNIGEEKLRTLLLEKNIISPLTKTERELILSLVRFQDNILNAATEYAPNKIASYVYEIANGFSSFYHENHILTEENEEKKYSYLKLSYLTKEIIAVCLDLLGIEIPDRM